MACRCLVCFVDVVFPPQLARRSWSFSCRLLPLHLVLNGTCPCSQENVSSAFFFSQSAPLPDPSLSVDPSVTAFLFLACFPGWPFCVLAPLETKAAWSPLRKLNKARFEVETAATHPPDSLVPAGDKSNAEEDDNFDEFTVDIANSDWTGGQGSPTSAPLSEAISFDGTKRTLDNGGQHLSSNDGDAASTPAAGGGSGHVERETSETAETAAQMFDGESGAADELRQPLLSSASSA